MESSVLNVSRHLKFLTRKNAAGFLRIFGKNDLPKNSRSYVTVSSRLTQSQEGQLLNTSSHEQQQQQIEENFANSSSSGGYESVRYRRMRNHNLRYSNNAFENFSSDPAAHLIDGEGLFTNKNFDRQTQSPPGYQLEQKLFLINNDIRRYGRVDPKILDEFLQLLRDDDRISSPVALTLLKACGSHMPMYTPEKRVEMLHKVWHVLKDHGFKFDVSHFNSLLSLYLENDHSFSPVEILARLEKDDIEPNRVTFQRLIKRYAQIGDMDGVNAILEHMKSLDMPITEHVCSSLLFGNIKTRNDQEVKQILEFMRTNGIEPSSECYVEMMLAYAENGDYANVEKIFTDQADMIFSDRDLLKIFYAFVKNGHAEHAKKILEKVRKNAGYIHEALDAAMKLNAVGHPEQAVQLLTTVHRGENVNFGGALLQQCVDLDFKPDDVVKMCNLMLESGVHKHAMESCYILAAENGKKDLATVLMQKMMQDRQLPLRNQCFWPLILMNSREQNFQALNRLFAEMRTFGVPVDTKSLSDWMWPHLLQTSDGGDHVTLEQAKDQLPTVYGQKLTTALLMHALNAKDRALIDSVVEKYCSDLLRDESLLTCCERYMHTTCDVRTVAEIVRRLAIDSHVSERFTAVDHFVLNYYFGPISEKRTENLKELFNKFLDMKICINPDMLRRMLTYKRSQEDPNMAKLIQQLIDLSVENREKPVQQENSDVVDARIYDALSKSDDSELKSCVPNVRRAQLSAIVHELSKNNETEKVLKLVQVMEDANRFTSFPVYMKALGMFVRSGDVENSLKFYNLAMRNRRSEFIMNKWTIMELLQLLAKNQSYDNVDRILNDILEMKQQTGDEKGADDLLLADFDRQSDLSNKIDRMIVDFFQLIFHDTTEQLGRDRAFKIFAKFCDTRRHQLKSYHTNPIMEFLINDGDLVTAVGVFEKMATVMKKTTNSVKLIQALAEKNDVANLQKVFDLMTGILGEQKATLKLAISLASINKTKEAMRIVSAPTVYLPPDMVLREAKRFSASENVKAMESLLYITKNKLPSIRDSLYLNLLTLYRKLGDYRSALNCWTMIQEENYTPSKEILTLIDQILKEHNQPSPFSSTDLDKKYAAAATASEIASKSTSAAASGATNVGGAATTKKSKTADLMQKLRGQGAKTSENVEPRASAAQQT